MTGACRAERPGTWQIRADTAEALFLILQTKDVDRETDEVEDVLLETEWSVRAFPYRDAYLIYPHTGQRVTLQPRRRQPGGSWRSSDRTPNDRACSRHEGPARQASLASDAIAPAPQCNYK